MRNTSVVIQLREIRLVINGDQFTRVSISSLIVPFLAATKSHVGVIQRSTPNVIPNKSLARTIHRNNARGRQLTRPVGQDICHIINMTGYFIVSPITRVERHEYDTKYNSNDDRGHRRDCETQTPICVVRARSSSKPTNKGCDSDRQQENHYPEENNDMELKSKRVNNHHLSLSKKRRSMRICTDLLW